MEECPTCGNEYSSLWAHLNRHYPEHKPDSWPVCPMCGDQYKQLGPHWSNNSCQYPNITDTQREILIGFLMGDGSVHIGNEGENPHIQSNMTNEEYLTYIDEKLGVYGLGVTHILTPEESADHIVRSGLRDNADSNDYSNIYQWRTRNSPEFEQFAGWYESGEKVFPTDITLTPTVLKHWYCCDGCYNTSNYGRSIKITMNNERGNKDKIGSYFSQANVPEPNFWSSSKNSCSAHWNVSETEKLFKYMGEPLPGFSYKWPDE